MALQRTALTYRDYEALPDDGRHYQVLDGVLEVTPSPSPPHQDVLANLNDLVRAHVKSRGLGRAYFAPIDVILADTTIVQPDLVYLATDRAHLLSRRGIEGPPTLVVEVLSPGTAAVDRGAKLRLYARYGVPYYWIADTDAREVEAYELADQRYRLASRAHGDASMALPPFADLFFVPDALWPPRA
jgi:Uma2 family endonuclease